MGRKSISSLRQQNKKKLGEDEEEYSAQAEEDKKEKTDEHQEKQEEEEEEVPQKRKRVRKRKAAESKKQEEEQELVEDTGTAGDRFNNERTVYMEGLPFDASEQSINEFFSSVGAPVGLRLPRWHDSGRLRGYGHVEFRTAEEASKAIKDLNGAYMGKRYVKLDRPMTPRIIQQGQLNANSVGGDGKRSKLTRPAGCRTVFVKNLPYECEESDVRDSFMVCGKIAKVRLAVWNHTGKLKGFGYVDFKSEESAEIAVNKAVYGGGINVKGRPVMCDFETGQAKASYKPLNST